MNKEELEQYFEINPESPSYISWKNNEIVSKKCRGKFITTKDSKNYYCVSFKRKQLKCHRIVMILSEICISNMNVDHKDGNTLNNNPENLRVVDDQTNLRNQKKPKNNKTGTMGVALQKDSLGYESHVAHVIDNNNKRIRKCFSVNKYGAEGSLRLACQWREQKIKELNEQGAGYTDRHGA